MYNRPQERPADRSTLTLIAGQRIFRFAGTWTPGARRKVSTTLPTTYQYLLLFDECNAIVHPDHVDWINLIVVSQKEKTKAPPLLRVVHADSTEQELSLNGDFYEEFQSYHGCPRQAIFRVLLQAEEVAEMGSWAFDPTQDRMFWSDGMYRLFELDPAVAVFPETFAEYARPRNDRDVQQVINHIRENPGPFVHTLLIETHSRLKRIKIQGTRVSDQDGDGIRMVGIAHDSSAAAESEQALREQSHFINNILKAMPDAINVINLQTHEMEYLNRATITHRPVGVGHFNRVSIREGIQRYVYPEDFPSIETYLDSFRNASDQEVHHVEYRARTSPEGRWMWFRAYGKVFSRSSDGVPNRCVNVIQNISDAKESMAEIIRMKETMARQAQRQYEELFRSIDQGFIIIELIPATERQPANLKFLTANPAINKVLGIDTGITNKVLSEIVPDAPAEWTRIIERIVATQRERRFTVHMHPLSDRWLEAFAFPTGDPRARQVAVLLNDITDRIRFEEDLRDRQLKLEIAQRAARVGIWTFHPDRQQGMGTQEWMELTGLVSNTDTWTLNDLLPRVYERDRDLVAEAFDRAQHEKNIDVEFRIEHPDQGIQWFLMRGTYVEAETVRVDALMGTLIDITERKQFEEQQDEFLAIASHELRTPVTSIKAYADILNDLLKSHNNNQWAMIAERLSSQVDRLTRLIRDLLDTTGLKSGGLTLKPELFNLTELIRDRVDEIRRATSRIIVFNNASTVAIYGDRDRIGQVIHNLLSNATKYSPAAAPVMISVDTEGDTATVAVRDFGVGLAPDEQERIFHRFYRARENRANSVTGLGLGLYVASEIVRKHGGTIGVTSRKGDGSRFYFSLPLQHVTAG